VERNAARLRYVTTGTYLATGTGVKGQAARIEECVASEGGCLYSLYCLEEVFSETELPEVVILEIVL
jgi:hypothetical protein